MSYFKDQRREKEIVNHGVETVYQEKHRMTGRTTRQINEAIEELFEKGETFLQDHHVTKSIELKKGEGKSYLQSINDVLAERLEQRFNDEHSNYACLEKKYYSNFRGEEYQHGYLYKLIVK